MWQQSFIFGYVHVLLICFICSIVPGVNTQECTALPPRPNTDVEFIGSSEPTNGVYKIGDVAVYKCENSGFGYLSLKCQGNNTWGSQSRDCDDVLEFELGSMIGVAIFGFSLVVVIVSVICSTVVAKEKPATAV